MEIKLDRPLNAAVNGRRRKSGRHVRAMKRMLKNRTDIDAVTRTMLLGLTAAWDQIEESNQGINSIPAISKELREIWFKIAPTDSIDELWS
jgi:hypothetical protein